VLDHIIFVTACA